jgi:hypothetical protein
MARFTLLLAALVTVALTDKATTSVEEVSYTVGEVKGYLNLPHIQTLGQTQRSP